MKSEVCRWRVSSERKTSVEREARRRKISLSKLLDFATGEWLKEQPGGRSDAEQTRLREAVMRCSGIVRGSDPHRAELHSQRVKEILNSRRDR